MNRILAYLTDDEQDEYPALGPFVKPLTSWEERRCDAFRATARLNNWYVIEDHSVPGVVMLTAKPMWVRPGVRHG